jgi:hypothetical protein
MSNFFLFPRLAGAAVEKAVVVMQQLDPITLEKEWARKVQFDNRSFEQISKEGDVGTAYPLEKIEAVAKKLEGSKRGEQFVANTRRAASASASARKTGQPSHYVVKQLDSKKDKSPSNSSEGNIDVSSRKTIKLSNGEIELFKPMAFRNAGKVIVVPTITEGGKLLTESGAINKYFETGMHLGIFDDMSEAKVRIEQLEKERFKDTPKENTAKKKEDKYDRRKHRRSLAVNPATIKPVIDPKANENQPKNGVMKRSDFLAQFE